MTISIKLIQSKLEFNKLINSALVKDLNRNLQKNKTKVTNLIRLLVFNWVKEQPEIASLSDENNPESLNKLFKFPQGQSDRAVNAICASVSASIEIQFEKIKNDLNGGIKIFIQPDNFVNLLVLSEATVVIKPEPLPWLDWLLTKGTNTMIFDYNYVLDNSSKNSGGFITSGKIQRIPPQFAGSLEDNFITRALLNREKELIPILKEAIYV